MANITKLITMTEKGSISGPYYDIYYSTDCISYTLAVDGDNVLLPLVGSTAIVTVPEETTCIKLVSTGPDCTNEVISNIGTTTTTTAPTTTTTSTTTCLAPGVLTQIQIGWDTNSSLDACNFQQTAFVWVVNNPPECGDYIYTDQTGCTTWGNPEQAGWVAWGDGYSYTYNYGTGEITCSSIYTCSSFTTTTTSTTSTTTAPTTTTTTTAPTTTTTTTTTVSTLCYTLETVQSSQGECFDCPGYFASTTDTVMKIFTECSGSEIFPPVDIFVESRYSDNSTSSLFIPAGETSSLIIATSDVQCIPAPECGEDASPTFVSASVIALTGSISECCV